MSSKKDSKQATGDSTTQEMKYERVEKVDVDKHGNATLKDVREGTGKGDPALNFTDHAPGAIVPGKTSGIAPGVAISSDLHDRSSTHSHSSSGYSSTSASKSSSVAGGAGAKDTYVRESESSSMRGGPTNTEGVRHGGAQSSTTRTETSTTVTSDGGLQRTAPMGVQREILVSGTGTGQISEHHEREVIKHESGNRQHTESTITVPVTSFQSTQMESVREGSTFTKDKALTINAPQIAPMMAPAQLNMNLGGASAEIHSSSTFEMSDAQIKQMGPEEYERYRQKVEKLTRLHEFETSQKAAEYRAEVERDAELIRRTLEKQALRDIDFRKDMIESGIERQEKEIQLEAEYAMRVLEQERANARAQLEQARGQSNIEVNIDSAVGTTRSVGHMATSTEKTSSSSTTEVKGSGATVVRNAQV